ncbi:MAG: CHAT domain-containing protein [Anaerolineae bacterium]|nr:CHAT domain-containing protein [Anaerolineae bacterium]
MNKAPCTDDLIEAFYRAYNATSGTYADRLQKCRTIIDELRTCAEDDVRFGSWCDLFDGILANEHDRDWGRGERLFRAALDAASTDDRLLRGRACLALAVTYHNLDRWREALAFSRQAVAALESLDKPIDLAAAWINVGIAYNSGYRYGIFDEPVLAEGIDACYRALDVLATMDSASVQRPGLEASAMTTLGILHNLAGQWEQALDAFRRHLAICQEAGYACRSGVSYNNLGEVYARMGSEYYDLACDALEQARRIHSECGDDFRTLEAVQILATITARAGDYERALAYALEAVKLAEVVRVGITSSEARAGFSVTTANVYAEAVLLAKRLDQTHLAFDLVEQSRSRAFLDSLAAGTSTVSRMVEAATVDLHQVQQWLSPDAVLLEYFTCGVLEGSASKQKARSRSLQFYVPPLTTLLFVITHDTIEALDLGLSPLDVLPGRLDSAVERHFLQPAIRLALYRRLVYPARHLLAGKRRITIVPHGPLHYVPFGALMDEDGQTLLHDGGPELVYGPSASVLFRDDLTSPLGLPDTPKDSGTPCLAIGYNGDAGNRLRFAEEEAESIAAMLGGQAITGSADKRKQLFQQGRNARYLHISCHGDFDPDTPLASSLHLAPGEFLTAQEVLDDLRLNCQLVTLSACESGLSRVRRGDELMGLVRAFMVAGAPAVVATLWRVDERSTRLLMQKFYQELAAGTEPATALHRSQLYLRTLDSRYTDPFYWAPFVLIGNARQMSVDG